MDELPTLFDDQFGDPEKLSAKKIFDRFCNRATKSLGQNFLFDEGINKKIVSAAGDLSEKIVMEIGPGPGGLTLEILKQPIKKLYIVEFDSRWAQAWRSMRNLFENKLEVIEEDALKINEEEFSPQIIISNLPYNISTQLLIKWLRKIDHFEKLVLMFQKEVADRLLAKPSTKEYGKLSVLTQWKTNVERIFDLSPGCFFPPPKVKSSVVKLTPKNQAAGDFKLFSSLLNDAFLHRRKLVIKSLAKYSKDMEQILSNMGYHKQTRAEEISVEDFQKLFSIVRSNKF